MIKLYNTLTRKKEAFKPIEKNRASFYHCGPTVYWIQHIGNLRGAFCADIVVRTLKYFDFKVNHVRNYTDVGHLTGDSDQGQDKISQAAQKEKLNPEQIANKYIKIFENDTKELNLLEPTHKPKATDCINEIIAMIQVLIDKNYAYSTDLAIYFDTSKAKDYTQLSGQKLADQIKQAGKGQIYDSHKKNPADFALWFFKIGQHKNALQVWPSPFKSESIKNGLGFPGWHIECSVMANKFLGKTIDLHMGGIEHIPIHHTNEIAQSRAANDAPLANYWLHNEHLLFDNKKMAKSTGSGLSLSQVKDKGFNPLALRYLFLQTHYRSKQNFTWPAMESAQKGFDNLKKQIIELGNSKGKVDKIWQKKFSEKISDDFNTPQALAIVGNMLKSKLSKQNKLAAILNFDKIFGLKLDKIKLEIPASIQKLAEQREQLRKEQNWQKADQIRQQIKQQGYIVKDTDQGPSLSPK